MSFHWPHAFWFLLVPLGLLALDLHRRRRIAAAGQPKILRAEADHRTLVLANGPANSAAGRRARWRLALGLACAVLALARPQWGRIEEPVFDQAREILIAVDLSRSMLAEDVKPSRLARAKLLITSLLERLEGERVGLIVFAGTSFLQSPLSADYEILREFLPALDPGYLPEGGTNFKSLLETSLSAFASSSSADRYLIVLSDGEAQTDDWQGQVPTLVERGVRVISLGIGSEAGTMIPDGEGSFVKDERGAVVLTRLQGSTLRDLAQRTHGVYADASQWVDLARIVNQTVETGRTGEFREEGRARLAERFQWALAPAVLLLLWSYFRDFPVHPRAKTVKLSPSAPPAVPATASALALAFALVSNLPDARAAESDPEPPGVEALAAPLSALVGQLAERPDLAARDFADLARTTATYGQRVKQAGQPVSPGPIRDGLDAVAAGEKQDASAADWPALRRDLEALLAKPEQPPESQDQNENQENQEENQKGDGQQGDGKKSGEDEQEKSEQDQSSSESKSDGSSPDGQDDAPPPPQAGQSAFGESSEPPPPPPPPGSAETQQIGGQPDRKNEAAERPELAIPLQKLEQLRNQDSPARLYQLMQDQKGQPTQKGRDW